jgi:exosome complex exonuclease DIS3/RRP44
MTRNLNMLAKKLKQKRVDNGALTLASTQVKFTFDDETHNPVDV